MNDMVTFQKLSDSLGEEKVRRENEMTFMVKGDNCYIGCLWVI